MGNDDINILFAGCIAVIMLIGSLFSKNTSEQKLAESEVHDAVEEKKQPNIE